jgi:Uma2 family endonuclease
MDSLPKTKFTVDEFLAWVEEFPGRYELEDGQVYGMAPQRLGHATTKFKVQAALLTAIRKAGLPCHMVPDGATVRISQTSAYEPDALVYCGQERPADDLEVPDPVIVVEVLSPGSRYLDSGAKLGGYFQVPSVAHYLIVDTPKRLVIHHARDGSGTIATRVVSEGTVQLNPPGLTLPIEACFSFV